MKLAIAGSRSYGKSKDGQYDYDSLIRLIDHTVHENGLDVSMVISGGANGPDKAGEYWAFKNNIAREIHIPNWRLGRGAGFANNKKIADEADALLVLYDGQSKGTKHVIDLFVRQKKPVYYAE